MKALLLSLVILLVAGCSCFAATATVDTYPGWNLIALPLVPFDPVVDNVLAGYDTMFSAGLTRWDASTQGMISYDAFDVPGAFGNMLLADGYWLEYPDAGTITYQGVPDGIPDSGGNMSDVWIVLAGNQFDGQDAGGWQLIGNPFNHDIPIDPNFNLNGEAIQFTDGNDVKIWSDAAEAGWVDSTITTWNGVSQGMYDVGYFFNFDDTLRVGHGYWIQTHKDNLAMIIPAN